ncbi:hypothetical protein [Fluviispira multicolorata]|uniref:Uncharacterized protein n=1 Tax=Fluviispira multicolorata TaxID=2654512 RepID=A0A833JFZ8_9BACT|nr:hypothetical protein [Fluviispira multicolorata]KAB8031917.1 hypothetical protein GCL57_04535 [Fluviispira multicolorata]
MALLYSRPKKFFCIISSLLYLSLNLFIFIPAYSQDESNIDKINSSAENAKNLKDNAEKFTELGSDLKNSIPKTEMSVPHDTKLPPPPGSFLDRFFGRTISIQVQIQKDSNENSAILTELVFIQDPDLYKKAAGFSMRDWFSNSPDVLNIKKSNEVFISRFEFTPEFNQTQYFLTIKRNTLGALLFTRLLNNLDTYPPYINPYKNLKLSFFYNGFDFKQNQEE